MTDKEQTGRCDESHTSSRDEQESLEKETRARWEPYRQSFNDWAEMSGAHPSEFDQIVEGQVNHHRVNYQRERIARELDEYSVRWDRITPEDVASLQELLDSDPDEAPMHRFLEDNPKFLIQVLTGGHGRYFISKPRLGSQYVPDFLIGDQTSMGIEWYAVEIESPRKKVYRKDGNFRSELNQAINQIKDWRNWLTNRIADARDPKEQDGLGLIGIDGRVPGLILIGRRDEYPDRYNTRRRQARQDDRIAIHSYDRLLEVARSNSSGALPLELRNPDF